MLRSILLILFLCLLAFSPYHALMRDKLHADDASYLAHGFTLGLDHNLQYQNSVAEWKTYNQKAAAHPIGPGLLAAPFISIFAMIDKMNHDEVLNNHTQFQYSWSFFGFVFASVFFFIAGLFCYRSALRCLSFSLSSKHLLFVVSSFGILFYVLFRPVMGHSFEFFTIALCFWASCKSYRAVTEETQLSLKYLLICALAAIMTLQIRPSDINVLLLPLIVCGFLWVKRTEPLPPRQVTLLSQSVICYLLSLIICFLPFVPINEQLYGMIYPSSSAMYGPSTNPVPGIANGADFLQTLIMLITRLPQLLVICFSSEFGLAFSSAILFFGSLFLLYFLLTDIQKKTKLVLINVLMVGAYIGLPITITLFWQSLGDAYGHRFLYCLLPLALLGYAYWHETLISKFKSFVNYPALAKSLQIVILVLCGYGVLSHTLFGVSSDLMYQPEVPNSFGRPGGSAVGYNLAVVKAAPKPSTWMNLSATRTPGFFLVGLCDLWHIDLRSYPLPAALSAKLDQFYCCYEHPPLRVYLQALLAIIFFVSGCAWLLKRQPDSEILRS